MIFWRVAPDGVAVMVKAQPRSRRPGIQGVGESASGPRLKIGVTEAPEDGKANRAVRAVLAKALGCPQAMVQIAAGVANREKTLSVSGDAVRLVEKLRSL